jgi:hypothetical protein
MFPTLNAAQIAEIAPYDAECTFAPGEILWRRLFAGWIRPLSADVRAISN